MPGKTACRLRDLGASSLVTPALTVAPLEPRLRKSVCSLISSEAHPRHVLEMLTFRGGPGIFNGA